MESINSWKDIPWPVVEQTVFRLQLRIYKAATLNDLEKMYKLQKTLISKSDYAKFLSVRRVTENNAEKKPPGIDNIIIKTPKEKFELASRLKIDGKCSSIKRTYRTKLENTNKPLVIPTIEDQAKQMLVYLALCPQWEAYFEENNFGFRPGRSVMDAIEAVWLGLNGKEKWILEANISKCLDRIDHTYLLDKCNTFPQIRNQINFWLKSGILDGKNYVYPEMKTPQGSIISPLLANIALHGIQEKCDEYLKRSNSKRLDALSFVRYADDFILMHPDKEILFRLKEVVQEFLKPVGLELHPTKTRLVHSKNQYENIFPGFTFLGFNIIHQKKRNKMRLEVNKKQPETHDILLITPSREEVKRHKSKLRATIRQYKGVSQERLIQKLNPIIRGWALSKRSQISSKIFQSLDSYLWKLLWNWARRRHPKMSKIKLKEMYWHTEKKSNWVFSVKKDGIIRMKIQLHSKIPIKRHIKVKGKASPFDGNLRYWAARTGKSLLIPPYEARLIREQNGRCYLCGNYFLPDDIIELDHIIPLALGGLNRQDNVHAVHRYCHIQKTSEDMNKLRRK